MAINLAPQSHTKAELPALAQFQPTRVACNESYKEKKTSGLPLYESSLDASRHSSLLD